MSTYDFTDSTSVSKEGYTEESNEGVKCYVCKLCGKQIKTEQGIKSHISVKHKGESIKRTKPNDITFDHEADGDSKKARLGTSVQVWWFRIAAMADVEIYSFMSIEAGKGYFTLCLLMCK